MTYQTRFILITLIIPLVVLCAAPLPSAAQGSPVPGSRVRVTTMAGNAITGLVVEIDADQLQLQLDQQMRVSGVMGGGVVSATSAGGTFAVNRSDTRLLEVSTGMQSGAKRWAIYGGGGGAALGTIWWLATPERPFIGGRPSPVGYVLGLGLFGAASGAAYGHFWGSGEGWTPAFWPGGRDGFAVQIAPGGISVRVAVW